MTKLPEPIPGLVIRYSYLWHSEYAAGREEGQKDRPCAIVAAVRKTGQATTVLVLPVTHSPPSAGALVIEIAPATEARLGLDQDRSWIELSEASRFLWPGSDIRASRTGEMSTVTYGELPARFFQAVRGAFLRANSERRTVLVPRTD